MVSVTPITTKYTPASKKSAVPTDPITAIGVSNQSPVIKASPEKTGNKPLKIDKDNPIGISVFGVKENKDKVSLVVLANECNTKAIEAISPPTNPPPDR